MNLETTPPSIACPKCRQPLTPPSPGAETSLVCPECATEFTAYLSDAVQPPELSPGLSTPVNEGDASCFFHEDRSAERTCDGCGRFICSVCDLPLGDRHLCPSCIEAAMKSSSSSFVRGRVRWDWIAFLMGVSPILGGLFFWWALPITGAAAIFLSVMAFRRPPSLVTGNRAVVSIFGGIFGLLQLVPFVGLIWFLVVAL